jgi:hypothetical protein
MLGKLLESFHSIGIIQSLYQANFMKMLFPAQKSTN